MNNLNDAQIKKLIKKTQKKVEKEMNTEPSIPETVDSNRSTTDINSGFIFYRALSDSFQRPTLYSDYFTIPEASGFSLTTAYPGLFIGSGYPFPIAENNEEKDSEYKLGFFFDHTTGLPVIPGSTVKGVLHRLFRKNLTKDESEASRKLRCAWINDILQVKNWITPDTIKEKEKLLFHPSDKGAQIIYHDAFISKADDQEKGIFADDYITPHLDDKGNYDPFIEPTPLKFLKIRAGVEMTFQFDFRQVVLADGITEDKLKVLFKQIILEFGIGARRNLGYGSFTAPSK